MVKAVMQQIGLDVGLAPSSLVLGHVGSGAKFCRRLLRT